MGRLLALTGGETLMRHRMRCVTWQGRSFRFQRMGAGRPDDTHEWSVSNGLEFIGTMSCGDEVTTREFELRCLRWLAELMG